jgi:hypothetical protein
MGARGRPSRAELSVVGFEEAEARCPDAPADLTAEQGAEWRAIVERMPAEWFPRQTHPLLAAYCRHTAASRRIAQLIAAEEASDAFSLANYNLLLGMQEREGRALTSLASKMRLNQASLHDRRKAPKPPSGPRPWEG